MPWARALFEQLEELTPADFADQIASMATEKRLTSPDALQSIERSLERAEQLFLWGHWNAERYRAERDRYEQLRVSFSPPSRPSRRSSSTACSTPATSGTRSPAGTC